MDESDCLWCLSQENQPLSLREVVLGRGCLCQECTSKLHRLHWKGVWSFQGHQGRRRVKILATFEREENFVSLWQQYTRQRDIALAPVFLDGWTRRNLRHSLLVQMHPWNDYLKTTGFDPWQKLLHPFLPVSYPEASSSYGCRLSDVLAARLCLLEKHNSRMLCRHWIPFGKLVVICDRFPSVQEMQEHPLLQRCSVLWLLAEEIPILQAHDQKGKRTAVSGKKRDKRTTRNLQKIRQIMGKL